MSDPKSFGQVTTQLREFATSLTMRQRLMLGGGALLVVVVLFSFVHMLSKPEMTTLYSKMEPNEAQAMGQQLAAKDIKYQLSPDGKSVLVPADRLDAARLAIASDTMPHSGRLGFELFDKTNWASSDFDDRVNYQRALEGELERTIQTMSGVEAARVHLALPPDSPYMVQERAAKAAVILKLSERRLTPAMRTAVQRLVAAAVEKLDPQAVTVVDAETGERSEESSGEERTGEEVLAARLVQTLEPIVGADHIRASVHAEFDAASIDEQEESYDPAKTVALTVQRSEETNGTPQPGGAAGTPSNLPGGGNPAKTSSDNATQSSKTESSTYAVNKVVRHSTQPAGRLKRLAVAVLVDDIYDAKTKRSQHRSPEELKSIEELAKASVGFDATRGDILSVQNIGFHSEPITLPTPTPVQKVQGYMREWSSYVRIAAMLLLFAVTYFVVLRPVKRQMMRVLTPQPTQTPAELAAQDAAAGLPEAPEIGPMAQLREDISVRIRTEPAAASRLVESWIKEGEK